MRAALDGVLGSELSLAEMQHLTTQPLICAPRGVGGGGHQGARGGEGDRAVQSVNKLQLLGGEENREPADKVSRADMVEGMQGD